MAKKVGQVNEDTGRVEIRNVHRVRQRDWPVTIVDTRGKRLARKLWG